MDWSSIQSRWDEYKVAAKRRWDKLSEQPLSPEEAERELATWQAEILATRHR